MAQFYKYDDNPTVYRGSDNYAFSSWDEFTKAGGTSGGIETRARSSAPSGFYVGTPTNAVTVNQLTPAAPVTLPKVPAKDTSGATAALETGSKSIEQYMKEATAPETETSKQQASYIKDLNLLGADLGGKQAALAAEEEKQGVGILQKDLAGLNSQIMQGVAELKQMQDAETKAMVDAEGKVIPIAAISGEQARIQRQQAVLRLTKQSDIGLLQARALGLQGQIESAKATAARAIDLRYEAKEDEYNLKLKQLDLIQPLLDKEQKIQATALQRKYEEEQVRIAEEKAKAKDNINLAMSLGINTDLVNKNGEFFNVRTGKTYSTPDELFKDMGVRSFDELYTRGLVSNVDNATIQEKATIGELKSKYWDAGITMSDTMESAQQKLKNSRIYRKETYIAPSGNAPTTLGSMNIVDPSTDAQVKAIINSRPGDGGYGAAYAAVQAKFGTQVANMYDKVYQSVFNQGASVDAGFNDAKLSKPASNLTDQQKLAFQNQTQDNMRVDPAIKSYGELVSFGVPTVLNNFNSGNVSNVSDTVLMRTLAKVTDPSTGVREEEYKTFEDSIGAINRVFTLPKKWVGKGRLTDEGRQQIIKEIQDRFNARQTDYNNAYQYYNQQAMQQGVTVPPPFGSTTQTTSPTLSDEQAYQEYLKLIGK